MNQETVKVGDKVRRICSDNGDSAKVGQVAIVVGTLPESNAILVDYPGHHRTPGYAAGEYWFSECAELVPLEIPASPFYVRTPFGNEYRINVDGLRFHAEAQPGNYIFSDFENLTRLIPGFFADGNWTLIDPPTPAVDPVVALTARVQQLLREHEAAGRECKDAGDVLNAAEEKRRDIGKLLVEAQRALDKSIHDAACVKWDSLRNGPLREIAEILADAR